MLKLYIRPVCFQRPEEEENSLSLLVESRREKVRTIKGKENRSRSIAAGLLLRHMLLEEQIPYAEESFGLEGHGKPRLKKDGVFFNLSHAGAYAVGALSDVPVGVDVEQQNRFWQEARNQKLAKRILTEAEWNWWKDAGMIRRNCSVLDKKRKLCENDRGRNDKGISYRGYPAWEIL